MRPVDSTAAKGRRAVTRGNAWRRAAVQWLNDHGWPGAGYELRNHSSDVTGTWDLAIELTDTTWDKMWEKLRQAQRDAHERGLIDYCVWKKPYGKTDPGEGEVIMRARQFFPLVMRLERLQHTELDAVAAYDRGYRNGQAAAAEHAAKGMLLIPGQAVAGGSNMTIVEGS